MHMIVFTSGTPPPSPPSPPSLPSPPSPPSLSLSGVNLTSDGMCSLTSVTVNWEVSKVDDFRYWSKQFYFYFYFQFQAPFGVNPITTPPVTNYQLSCILEGSLEDVCSGIRVINGTNYQIPGSNFQQLGNYLFSVRANNAVGLSEDSNISFISELVIVRHCVAYYNVIVCTA